MVSMAFAIPKAFGFEAATQRKSEFGAWVLSVILERFHPFGPVFRQDAAGLRPGIGPVVAYMPSEREKLL
jgi:hypothetical protein